MAALDRLEASPGRILDIGAGTGAAALELADRYPDAEVVGIDVSAEMVAQAKAKADRSGRVRLLVADIASVQDEEGFDLIAMLTMPPFFDRIIALLRPGGFVVDASSFGSRTPFFTPPALLAGGFERRGLVTIAAKQVGMGTYYLAGGCSGANGSKRSATAACRRSRAMPPPPVPLPGRPSGE